MSRSRKKTPFFAITAATSEKKDKRIWNRLFRRVSKQRVRMNAEAPIKLREVSDIWTGDKDGKYYRRDYTKASMRK